MLDTLNLTFYVNYISKKLGGEYLPGKIRFDGEMHREM